MFPPEQGLPVRPAAQWQYMFEPAPKTQVPEHPCSYDPNNDHFSGTAILSGYTHWDQHQYQFPQTQHCQQAQYPNYQFLPHQYHYMQ
jgi:hypothetical protein